MKGQSIRLLGTPMVYIAGPYSKGDQARNVAKAMLVSDTLMRLGYRVYVPHLSHFQHMNNPRTYWDWLEHGIGWLMACDAVLVLPGSSFGTRLEVELATKMGKPVFKSVGVLEQSLKFEAPPRPPYEEYIVP